MDEYLSAPEAPGLDVPTGTEDGGVADAAAALEHQVANPGSAEPAPTAATAGRGTPPPPQAPPKPSWQEGNRNVQQSFAKRQQALRREASTLRQQQEASQEQIRKSNELLQTAIEAVRQGRPAAEAEPMPDPYTDGPAFAAWLAKQSEATVSKLLGPIAESLQRQDQRFEQSEQQRLQQSQQTEQQRARMERIMEYEAAYMEAAPEISYGVRARTDTIHSAIRGAFEARGHPTERAALYAGRMIEAVGADAEAAGENPVAAIDLWGTSLVMHLLKNAGVDVVPVEVGDPLDWSQAGGEAGYDGGYQQFVAPVAPQAPTEAQRLAAVRQRAGSVGNAGPRAPSRTQATRSETMDLVRSGVTDVAQIYQAALREAGGNKLKASEILGTLT